MSRRLFDSSCWNVCTIKTNNYFSIVTLKTDRGFTTCVTGQQGMLTPQSQLIPPLSVLSNAHWICMYPGRFWLFLLCYLWLLYLVSLNIRSGMSSIVSGIFDYCIWYLWLLYLVSLIIESGIFDYCIWCLWLFYLVYLIIVFGVSDYCIWYIWLLYQWVSDNMDLWKQEVGSGAMEK